MKLKQKLLFLFLAILPALGCGVDQDPVNPTPECGPFLVQDGKYDGYMVATENGEVFIDQEGTWTVFQSAGAGTSWAGIIGTAKAEQIDAYYVGQFAQFTITTSATITAVDGVFDVVYDSDDQTFEYHYEITNLRPSEQASAVAYSWRISDFVHESRGRVLDHINE